MNADINNKLFKYIYIYIMADLNYSNKMIHLWAG